ncbi:sirohydrochlorin chelatase [Actinocrinis puniceicyclus]|uniref:Sirohydrochlorin chelatase n=1 Tax=Actinocrinis puniceicyclus TaxID=977794 RepID=A0A8J8BGC6_9ACTN|nr:sirohydrochlorin chelatase [Actinocrinis puniceicyclus]
MTALLIVGHGTRALEGAAQFRAFVRRVGVRAAARADVPVEAVSGGFIELSSPPLREAVAQLVAGGVRDVVAVPLILLAAGHAKGDIPAALARERGRHPGLRVRYARPLGVHPVLLELLRERLAASVLPRPDAVLLVGRGTTDPDANAELHRAARLLWETTRQSGIELVEPAFVSLASPSVQEGLERLRRLGARRVTVLPYFLFAGVLPDRIVEHSARGARSLGLEVAVAGLLGDDDALADLVLDRFAEAVAGPVAVNCDACVYRIAMPGFESRVGAAQRPHDHPDDPARHGHHHDHGLHDHGLHDHDDHSLDRDHSVDHGHGPERSHVPGHGGRAGDEHVRDAGAGSPAGGAEKQGRDSPVVGHAGPASVR